MMYAGTSMYIEQQTMIDVIPAFHHLRCHHFTVAQRDPAAFSVILALASADVANLNNKLTVTAMEYCSRSITMLRVRMNDEALATDNGTLATVALQVIFQVS